MAAAPPSAEDHPGITAKPRRHWGDPELSADGRWRSAPVLDVDSGSFRREGRGMVDAVDVAAAMFATAAPHDETSHAV